jgi:hypothetical protein
MEFGGNAPRLTDFFESNREQIGSIDIISTVIMLLFARVHIVTKYQNFYTVKTTGHWRNLQMPCLFAFCTEIQPIFQHSGENFVSSQDKIKDGS